MGKGQIRAADYVPVPDLIPQNSNAIGNAVGGLLVGLLGGKVGAVASGLSFRSQTTDVVLTLHAAVPHRHPGRHHVGSGRRKKQQGLGELHLMQLAW